MLPALNRCAVGVRFMFDRMEGPERILLSLSLVAWFALALVVARNEIPLLCLSSPDLIARFGAGVDALARPDVILTETTGWLAMIAAMMFPLLLHPVRHVALRSFRDRRSRAVAGFLIGYAAPWLIAGLATSVVMLAAKSAAMLAIEVAGPTAFAAAALWQFSAIRRRALRRCHRTAPLAPRGLPADLACLRFGASHGFNCLVVCGPAMLAVLMLSHSILLCAILTAFLFLERGRLEPSAVPLASVLATIAAGWLLVTLLGRLT